MATCRWKRLLAGGLGNGDILVLDHDRFYTVERVRASGLSRRILMVTSSKVNALGYRQYLLGRK